MSYRLKVNIFFLIVFLALLIMPVMNVYRAGEDFKFSRETLFNIDYFIPSIQRRVFDLGVSLDPKQVFIGKEGWLYLGDRYKSTVTARRKGLTSDEAERARDLQFGLAQWDSYFKSEGVKVFQVMMGPDKATIYPEYLPDWAKPAEVTRTDALLEYGHSELISDLRLSLIDAKSVYRNRLYYKTDTHWNSLGAWVGFNAFIKDLATEKGLIQGNWLSNDQVSTSSFSAVDGGDLANFLRLKLPDERPFMSLGKVVNVTRIEFNTGEIEGDGGNPDVSPPSAPLLFRNSEALNDAKVLWLRDSFGGPISPFMSATFSEVLQIHYVHLNSTSLVDMVKSFRPDYVFITAAERELFDINIGLSVLPPQFRIENGNSTLEGEIGSHQNGLNDISIEDSSYTVISIVDPFIVFDLEQPIETSERSMVAFNLICADGTEEVNLQMFWPTVADPNFSEANSIRFLTKTGDITINLSTNKAWLEATRVGRLRIDLDSANTCNSFSLSELKVGF